MVRLYPRGDSRLAIGAADTLDLPRRGEGRILSPPLPVPGNREDHEAFLVSASSRPIDFGALAREAGAGDIASGISGNAESNAGHSMIGGVAPRAGGQEESMLARTGLRCFLAVAVAVVAALTAVFAPLAPARAEAASAHGVALIIGNADYEHRDVPDVSFAHRDADSFRAYVVEVLGFDPENVIDLRDATRRELFDALGTKRDPRSLLWSYLDPEGSSDVVVFYSGHGVPGVNDGRGYLLPVDADPKAAEDDGYPIDLLYRNVGGLAEARSVRVYLDACFSGGSHEGGLIRNASPVFVEATLPEGLGEKVTSLAAASGKQVASWDEESRHGLFTHHLLDALYGGGDADGDGRVTALEAKGYLDRHMTRAARRQHRRIQQASLVGVTDVVLAAAAAGGAFPARPGSEADANTVSREDNGHDGRDPPLPPVSSIETAEDVEASLGLTYEQRVLVQLGLASLGVYGGVADGVFSRRTRAAVLSYRKKKGLPETGYLTSDLSDALQALGREVRAEARRVEEERRLETERAERAAKERQADDAAFAEAKRLNTPGSYRSYLDRGGRHEAAARELLAAASKPKWEVGKRFRDCAECPEMVVVPSGSYEMGSPWREERRRDNEGPVHRVTIAEPFAVGVYEVTFREWDACRRDGGCSHDPDDRGWGRGDRPVIDVSWDDAKEYVRWLSRETGEEYRLPSESEWEYVARAGTTGPFHFGSTISPEQANYNGNHVYGSGRKGQYRKRTVPVGSFSSNAFGLHDVHGNVREWVEDCWHGDYSGAPSDGSAWEWKTGGDCGSRVLRGGSWSYAPRNLRSADRNWFVTGSRYGNVGFRVARTLGHWPQTERRAERETKEHRADDEAFAEAKRLNTPGSYLAYLVRGGRHEAEARKLFSEALKPRWEVGRTFRDCPHCPEMVVVPAGSYEMGSPSWEAGRDDDEGPMHRVTIRAPFAVGVYEVTREEWSRFVGSTGYSMGDCGEAKERSGRNWRRPGFGRGDGHPVLCVSWADAKAFVRWLSGETGEAYRLLSESEWEYVARGGTTASRYWGAGENGQCRHANGADRALKRHYRDFEWSVASCDDGHVHTAPVGSFVSNGYGLHDVLGNVWEWVEDCWHDSYGGAPSDGATWTTGGECGHRVARGGSWIYPPWSLRSAFRAGFETGERYVSVGLRVARTLD